MAYVSSYQHDVFVSYCHVDDESTSISPKGWISVFLDELETRVCRNLGKAGAISIWRDVQMFRNDALKEQVEKQLTESATMLVMHSHGYVESEWCQWERELFTRTIDSGRNEDDSIFLVELSPIAPEDRASDLQNILGYRFWRYEDDGRTPMVLGEPLPSGADELFRQQLRKLAHDLSTELKERRATHAAQDPNPIPPPVQPSVQGIGFSAEPPTASPPPTAPQSVVSPVETSVESAPKKNKKIMLAYKRDTMPDLQVLDFLETELRRHGYDVFIDRHLRIGVLWAQEIANQIKTSYALIPLISEVSVRSEMLGFEVQEAAQNAEKNNGEPYILPVRISYQGALPKHFPGGLDRLNYFLWESESENQALIKDILDALENPSKQVNEPIDLSQATPAGGAVALDSAFYVERDTDKEFQDAIIRRDSIVLVKGARQIGKTSLLARGLQLARDEGSEVVHTDMQQLSVSDLESPDTLFRAFAEILIEELDLDVEVEECWVSTRGPSMNFKRFMRRQVLKSLEKPLVWGLDEVDRLFSCDFASEVFGLFRSWHNERALNPSGSWAQLTLAMAYATEAHLFITDVHQSPFNVGTRLTLDDFTLEQVTDLNNRYGCPIQSSTELSSYHQLVGGHPYLTQRGFNELVLTPTSFAEFAESASLDEGIYGDHLRRILIMLSKSEQLRNAVAAYLQGTPFSEVEHFWRLRSAGVLVGDAPDRARFRCPIYQTYLERHLT